MRNYAAEMREFIDEQTAAAGTYVPRAIATRIVTKLRERNPELLRGWLDEQAEHFVWQAINDRDRSTRARARQARERSAFRDAAERYQNGEPSAMVRWLDVPYTLENGSRSRLADMTSDDLLYVANEYERQELENKMEKAFLRALARKVGDGKVVDHLDEDQIRAIRASLRID